MNKLKGKVTLELTVEAVNHINALLERDDPKPPVDEGYFTDGSWHEVYRCPVCNAHVGNKELGIDAFCIKCGQRIDRENIAL